MEDDKRLLSSKNSEYLRLSGQKAEAEYAMNVAIADVTLRMKTDGSPATLISTLVKGNKAVAKLILNYQIACGQERACLESMKDLRSSIDAARSLLTWQRMEYYNQ